MIFTETPLKGAYTIDLEKIEDERGYFARAFCVEQFKAYGLDANVVQANSSLCKYKATLRGMHYQLQPHWETKIVRCVRGCIFDVIVDLRPDSSTFKKWFGAELSAANGRTMYCPKGFAHGFISLTDDAEAFYLVTEPYNPQFERGLRWNDPMFDIVWPMQPEIITEKDANHRNFDLEYHLGLKE